MESRHEQWQRESDEATMSVNRNKYLKLIKDYEALETENAKLRELLQQHQTYQTRQGEK